GASAGAGSRRLVRSAGGVLEGRRHHGPPRDCQRPDLDRLEGRRDPHSRLGAAMERTVADANPKTLENAKRQFVELYGSALVMNTYLKVALVLVSLVALGLLGLNFHIAARAALVKP